MSVIDRLLNVGRAEANAALDRIENPLRLTTQGIHDMRRDLEKCFHALAEVKAMAIRARNDIERHKANAMEYEEKAIKLLRLAADGNMDVSESDRLAAQALIKKDESFHHASCSMGELLQFEESIDQLESNISRLKATIGEWENELSVLQARYGSKEALVETDDTVFCTDTSETIAMLERMKAKVAKDEYLAQAYEEIINNTDHIDREIDEAIKVATKSDKQEELRKLKSTLGLNH